MVKALHVQRAFQLMERLIQDTWHVWVFSFRKKTPAQFGMQKGLFYVISCYLVDFCWAKIKCDSLEKLVVSSGLWWMDLKMFFMFCLQVRIACADTQESTMRIACIWFHMRNCLFVFSCFYVFLRHFFNKHAFPFCRTTFSVFLTHVKPGSFPLGWCKGCITCPTRKESNAWWESPSQNCIILPSNVEIMRLW